MGMPISVHLRGERVGSDPRVPHAVAAAFDTLREADTLFSTYRSDSEVSRLNRGELTVADSHPLVREVVDLCEQARERTRGFFDAMLPAPAGGRWFDPSGLVKGWAVQRAAERLAGLDGYDYYLNAGGDLAVGLGSPDEPAWRIGIQNPREPGEVLTVVEVAAGGMATSGTAARGAHIVNPHTGRPVDDLLSVTVLGPTLLWADVYATAAFAMGADAASWLRENASDHTALVVDADGRVTSTILTVDGGLTARG